MSWVATAVVASTAVGVGSKAYGAYRASKARSNLEGFVLPEYEEDPDYREAQDLLKSLGKDILEGNIPEYYAPIGEFGGGAFDNYLSLLKGDVEKSVLDSAAATGRRGGAIQASIAEGVGDVSTKTRYADYLRALEGRSALLNKGIGIEEGVRAAGQQEGVNKNRFNLGVSELDLNYRKALDEADLTIGALQGEAYGALADSIQGGLMGFGSYKSGGPISDISSGASGIDWSTILSNTNPGAKQPDTVGGAKSKNITVGRLYDRVMTTPSYLK